MTDDWIYISDVVIDDKVNTIHCDTRDFHCAVLEDKIDLRDGKEPDITKRLYDEDYNITENAIVPWLQSLEKMSGGKKEWRMLSFDLINNGSWLKYIRIYRNPKKEKNFIVCDRDGKPIKWRDCDESNFIEDLCNAHD